MTCCRIDDLVNTPDQPQRITTTVDLSGTNLESPVPKIPMLLPVVGGCPNSIPLLATDPDGFTCTLATDADAGTTGAFSMFDPPMNTVSVAGCVLTWQPPDGFADKYALQILLQDNAADSVQIAVDLILEVKDGQCCGNDDVEGVEICDGSDDAACPGGCQANCTCCGDGLTQAGVGELCDGPSDAACPGGCQANCTCCGDGVVQAGVGEVCDAAANAACFPSPGFGCGSNCQCAVPGGPGSSSCVDVCTNDVSVCSGTVSGIVTVDAGVPFSTTFTGTDPCDALIVNDPPWGLLPGTFPNEATLTPAAGTMQSPPSLGTCSHNPILPCSSCDDCVGCTHDQQVSCTTDPECAALSSGSTCITSSTCIKPPTTFPVTFDWTPDPTDAAQTHGASVTFTPPGFTVPGGTQYFCDFQLHVRGCGDDVVDPGEQCDGTETAACSGAPCLPPSHVDPLRRCQCAACGDDEINQPSEVCDGLAASACNGAPCLGDCTCARCGDDAINQPGEQCDGAADAACPGLCLPSCICAVCGDGIVHPGIGERCEPTNDAACPGDCVAPPDPNACHCRDCGDDIVNQPSEQCDGTADAACPGLCLSSCLCATCGDGAVNQPSEQCDGAADAACPGLCGANCLCATCGDGDVNQPSEQCDGADDATCPGACLPNCVCGVCGDGAINQPSEQCDGADAALCVGECLPAGDPNQCQCPVCGDGDVNRPAEQCDGADDAACPGSCLGNCLCAVCGDGVVTAPEGCEPGNDPACPGLCRPPADPNACACPICGDGDVNQGSEQCDGGDDAACPGLCSASCACAVCGDGIVAAPVETCDGPSDAACPGACPPPAAPNACHCPTCGDGTVNQSSEDCDGAALGTCATGVCEPDCTYATCGNCALDTGEACDPPNREICNNLIDDDGDGQLNCADVDCTPARTCRHPTNPALDALLATHGCASSRDCNHVCTHDLTTVCTTNAQCAALAVGSTCIDGARCECPAGSAAGFPTCGAACETVFGCGCILDDPARIRFGKAGQPGVLKIHGRFVTASAMNPPAEDFTILLSNESGIVYRATLLPGDLAGDKGRFKFLDKAAKKGTGARDGLYKVDVRIKTVKGALNYVFRVQAYGDFSDSSAVMMTQVIAGNDTASLSGQWSSTPQGWKLTSFE